MLKRKAFLTAAVLSGLSPMVTTESSAQTAVAGETFFALLNGNNECNGATPPLCQQGDLRAYGSAEVTLTSSTSLCFAIVVNNLASTPTLAHIHNANSTVNGPVVVPLTPPAAGNPGTSSGCVTGLAKAVVSAIAKNPQNHYVNVHSSTFPGGALRGQLF